MVGDDVIGVWLVMFVLVCLVVLSIRRVVAEIIIVSSPEAKYFRSIRKIYKNMQNKKSQNQEAKNAKEPRTRKIKQYDGGRSDHLEANESQKPYRTVGHYGECSR